MRNQMKKQMVWMCASILAIGTMVSWADGLRNPPEGGAAMGRAGVRLTQGDDPSAISHNPANLMDLSKPEAMVAATIGYSTKTYTSPTGVEQDAEDPWVVMPAVYAVVPLEQGRYAAGIGINTPYGQSAKWAPNGPLSYGTPDDGQMRSANVNPTFSTKLAKDVMAGVGVDILWSDLQFKQSVPPGVRMSFKGDGWGYGANAGLTWLVAPRQRVAVSYRSSIAVDYDGDLTAAPAGALPPGGMKLEGVEFPAVAGFGYGAQVTRDVRVEANVEWVQHSVNKTWTMTNLMGVNAVPQNWDDTWTYGVGADWQLNQEIVLRCGWTYLPSPIPDSTVSPLLSENDKHVLAVGFGYKRGVHAVDVGYAYTLSDDREVSDPRNPVNGTYDFNSQLLSASYRFAF